MTPASVPAVAVVVIASRGGPRLARALASVAWAGERVVLDATGRLGGAALPPGVRRARDPGEPAGDAAAPWLLLLHEDEVAPPALAAAVAATVAGRAPTGAYRIAQEVRGFGAALRPVGAPVRLARRPGARLRLRPGLGVELRCPAGGSGELADVRLVACIESLATAVDDLEADGAVLAALLRAAAVRPRVTAAVRAALVAAGRVLLARGTPGARAEGAPPGRARWALAVLAGYRALVAFGTLWEGHQVEASTPG